MRKLHPEQHLGIEYIRLSNLPFDQMINLKNWLSDFGVFTIDAQEGTIPNCVHYEDYEFWFDNIKNENPEAQYSIF